MRSCSKSHSRHHQRSICESVLFDGLHTVKAPLCLYKYGHWHSDCGGPFGVVVYHYTVFLVRSQAWPLGLNISLSSTDPCPLGAE